MRTICEIFLSGWRRSDNPEDTELRAPAHFSQVSDSERPTKVVSKSKSKQHSSYIHFQTDRNCEVYLRTKMTRAPCSRRTGEVLLRAEKFGDLITADHKVLNEESESRNNQPWFKILPRNGFNLIGAKQRLYRRRKRVYENASNRCKKKRELFMLTVHQNLENLVKIYCGIIEPQHFIVPRRMVSLRES